MKKKKNLMLNKVWFLFIINLLIVYNTTSAQINPNQALLYRAVMSRNLSLLDSLTSLNDFRPNEVFKVGLPVLHMACLGGDMDIVKLLVSKGADVNLLDLKGNTPAYPAILRGHTHILDYLMLQNIDLKIKNNNGQNLIGYLVKNGQTNQKEIVGLLIDKGVDINSSDIFGKTPMYYAILNRLESIGILLLNNGAEVNWKDKNSGKSLLHYCAIYDCPGIAQELINSEHKINIADNESIIPLIYAYKYNNYNVAKILEDNKTDKRLFSNFENRKAFREELENGQAVCWYLNHRGWAINTQTELLIFDYEEGMNKPSTPSVFNGWIESDELKDKSVISLYTCWHGYENEGSPMHDLEGEINNIDYILNNDDRFKGEDYYIKMNENESVSLRNFNITSFRSDYMTLGYLIEGNGLSILYTGFPDTANLESNLELLRSKVKKIDILLISGIGMDNDPGKVINWSDYIIKNFSPKYIIPKDNKRNEDMNLILKKEFEAKYPESIWYIARYPGDRIHI